MFGKFYDLKLTTRAQFLPQTLVMLLLMPIFVFFSLREFDGPSLKIEGTGEKFCQCLSIVTNLIRRPVPFVWFSG